MLKTTSADLARHIDQLALGGEQTFFCEDADNPEAAFHFNQELQRLRRERRVALLLGKSTGYTHSQDTVMRIRRTS